MTPVPNPGSATAQALGCTCPVMDNCYGLGAYDGNFWISQGCPLHDPKEPHEDPSAPANPLS